MRVLFDAIEQSFEMNNIYGVVEDIYSGTGTDYIHCLQCSYKSERKIKFYDLQLPIINQFENVINLSHSSSNNVCLQINNDSIEKAIFGYLKPETLQGENAYHCPVCNTKTKAIKGSKLQKLPQILTLQLNRFTLDIHSWQHKKLNDRVSFPLTLNMNHFLEESAQSDLSKTI